MDNTTRDCTTGNAAPSTVTAHAGSNINANTNTDANTNTNTSTGASTRARIDQTFVLTPSISTFMGDVVNGDAPITTLMQRQDVGSSVAARQAKVQRVVEDAMAGYRQSGQ
ncbi:hypothetical protein AAE478_005263 [Parahypoxylon ruwenzoriense]